MSRIFDHEKLEVRRAALAFLAWLEPVLQQHPLSPTSDYGLHDGQPRIGITITIYE